MRAVAADLLSLSADLDLDIYNYIKYCYILYLSNCNCVPSNIILITDM